MRHALPTTVAALAIACLTVLSGCGQSFSYKSPDGMGLATGATASGKVDRDRAAEAEAFAGPALGDEIWVIARADGVAPVDDDVPGAGTLVVPPSEQGGKFVAVPLKHTDVKASISAYIATVDVTQQFHNPFDAKIEAVYVFPLPQNAAVNEFVMTIGERRIRGIIREKAEAERIYNEARDQGYVASLLTQQRPNVFTQKVANIEPGKQIDVHIRYLHTLSYQDGWYEWVFPMTVGPRFNPAGYTDGIGAAARGNRGRSGQSTEVEYLAPDEDSGSRISLQVDVDAGVAIEQVTSVNHKVNIAPVAASTLRTPESGRLGRSFVVELDESDNLPNKDFVLRWKVAGERIKASLLTESTAKGNYFTLMLVPPAELEQLERRPMEMVFVIDASGSMSGTPIEQAKDAVLRGLDRLQTNDTFQVIQFSSNASQFGPNPVPVTSRTKRAARDYVRGLGGSGGTRMIEGIKAALDFPHDSRRLRTVTFLTDGYIGNDREIIGAVARRVGPSRVFSFGVGSSPNRYLMDRMAKLGRGAVAYLSNNEDGGEVMDRFFDALSHAALTDVRVDFGGMRVDGVYPRRPGDLIVGRPVIIAGRYTGKLPERIVVSGYAADRKVNIVIPTADQHATKAGIETVWARARIADLYDQLTVEPSDRIVRDIRRTALDYRLMSAYTAFVAVDSSARTAGEFGTTVRQPVPVPDGVRYETTVEP